jgi:hypothetical protein
MNTKPIDPLPLRWVRNPETGRRVRLPALTSREIHRLFNLAERSRRSNPEQIETRLNFRGRCFTVDETALGLRLWFGRHLLSRRWN